MENSKKALILILLGISSFSTSADEKKYYEEKIINSTTELKEWCKNESSMYFLAQDITPFNWTAFWWTEANFLHVKGAWKIKGKEKTIKCSVRRGVSEKYAIWKIVEE